MRTRIENLGHRLSLAQRFMLASLIALVFGMAGLGWWIGHQIEVGAIRHTAVHSAMFVDSLIAPHLQELGQAESLKPEHVGALNRLPQQTVHGHQIAAFKVWDAEGRILYSTHPSDMGRLYPMSAELVAAWQGEVTAELSNLQEEENAADRGAYARLLETYSPVRLKGTGQIIAVAELHETVDHLEEEITVAQRQSWLVVGATTLVIYLLLAGFVRQASDTIGRQRAELSDRVRQLTALLAQNQELHKRVRRAAANAATLNERFLRGISADLHDGPTQHLSLALLWLDRVVAYSETGCRVKLTNGQSPCAGNLEAMGNCLDQALKELRAIAVGLAIPQLDPMTLSEVVADVVYSHEARTGAQVKLSLEALPDQVPLPVKLTVYRLIQEALNNAYRHAADMRPQVRVSREDSHLSIEVSDQGAGFDATQPVAWDRHLGIIGMRQRVESLGGHFQIEGKPGRGTKVVARLPLQIGEGDDER